MSKFQKKALKVLVSILVSVVFCYYAFRGIEFSKVFELIRYANPLYVGATVLNIILVQILRSLRWGVLLHPMESLDQKLLFPITSIGFMFIAMLPARLGEMARPYLLQKNSKINFSSATATVVLEHILDSILILGLLVYIISLIEPLQWIIDVMIFFVLGLLLVIGLLIAGGLKKPRKNIKKIIYCIFPYQFASLIRKFMEKFYSGMSVLGKGRHLLVITILTVIIWSILMTVNWLLFSAFDMNLGALAAIHVLVFTSLGMFIPAGPGFIGTFHFACIIALGFFSIDEEMAIGYAVSLHFLTFGTILMLGFLCSTFSKINMIKLSKLSIFRDEKI